MEINPSRLTPPQTHERVVPTNTLGTGSPIVPESDTTTNPAVQSYLQSNSTPSSREAVLQQFITSSLATLLTELEAITEATLLELADPLSEFIQELTEGSGEAIDGNRSQRETGSTSAKNSMLPPSQTTQSAQAPTSSGNPLTNNTTLEPKAPPQDRSGIGDRRTALQRLEPEKGFSAHPHEMGEKISTNTRTDTRQTLAAPPSFVANIQDKGKIKGGQLTTEHPTRPLHNDPMIESPPNQQRVISQTRSTPSAGIPIDPERQDLRSSPATDRTAVALGPKVNLTTIVSMRDLIRSLLSQPGALRNQLEPGLFKALMSALSDEAALHVVAKQPQDSTVDPASPKSGGLSIAKQLDMTSRNSSSNRSSVEKIFEPLYGTKSQTPQAPNAQWGLAATIQSAPGSASPSENVNSHHLPGASPLLAPGVQQPQIPKLSFGALSDPALLAALQGAALRRNYSDVLKRRKRPVPQGSQQHNTESERDDINNDASRESRGLSLLRAFLEQRSPKTGPRI